MTKSLQRLLIDHARQLGLDAEARDDYAPSGSLRERTAAVVVDTPAAAERIGERYARAGGVPVRLRGEQTRAGLVLY